MRLNLFRKGLMVLLLSTVVGSSFGAELYRKQSGTVSLTGASVSVPIEPVCMSNSFMVFSMSVDNTSPDNFLVGGEIASSASLNFERDGSTGTVTIKWQVFEFSSGVTVQHGSSTNVGNTAVSISSVDLTKSFVIATGRNNGSQYGSDDGFSADLTTATNLQLVCTGSGHTEIFWQVVQYDDAVVKKVTGSVTAGNTSGTSTISPAVSDLSKTMVISNHTISGNINADDLARTELTNATTVSYTRSGNASQLDFVTYVVEFTDETTVTRGNQTFASTVVSQNAAITASTTTSGVIPLGNQTRQGNTSFASDDNPGHAWFTYEITSTSNLLIERATGTSGGNSTAEAPWQIVTFGDRGTTYYSFASGAWEANTSWSLSSDGSSGAVAAGVFPGMMDNVVIRTGHNITINNVADNGYCGISPDDLNRSNVGSFTGSGDAMFYHIGDIIISNGGTLTSTEEVMLEGYTHIEAGGTLNVNEDIVNLGYLEVSAATTFSNTDDLILSGNSTTIINNTSTGFDDIYIDHTNATLCGDGVMNIGNGSPDPTIQYFNGSSINQICSTFTVTCSMNCPGGFPVTGTGSFTYGITGPGGVGNQNINEIWLMADQGAYTDAGSTLAVDLNTVQQWHDISGNGRNAFQNTAGNRPIYRTGQDNGMPALQFTGNLFIDSPSLGIAGTSDLTYFITFKDTSTGLGGINDGNGHYILDRTTATNALMSLKPISGNVYTLQKRSDAGSGLGGPASTTTINTNIKWVEMSRDNGTTYSFFYDGVSEGSLADGDGNLTPPAMRIGRHATTNNNGLRGFIHELFVYSSLVNNAQRILINNYLSAKYAMPLSVNDVYTMDTPANGDYDAEVAGI
ncbi:MAG: hypothetical protein ABJH04_20935, partial [Cyclobacteriaceae bacterium]